jgi:hypothetical protein
MSALVVTAMGNVLGDAHGVIVLLDTDLLQVLVDLVPIILARGFLNLSTLGIGL